MVYFSACHAVLKSKSRKQINKLVVYGALFFLFPIESRSVALVLTGCFLLCFACQGKIIQEIAINREKGLRNEKLACTKDAAATIFFYYSKMNVDQINLT